MDRLQVVRDVVGGVAIIFCYITAVLGMALVDAGMTLLLFKASGKIKKAVELDQPKAPLPELPPDHKVDVVIGGGLRKWT
jgi:hypothetical protein